MPVDIKKFTKHLRDNVALMPPGKGRCGEYVRKALQAGGANFNGSNPGTGKEYGPTLLRLGFHEIIVANPDTFNFMPGDIMVMEPYEKSTNNAGHVAGYDGRNWISDFIQNDYWAGPRYRKERPKNAVFRY